MSLDNILGKFKSVKSVILKTLFVGTCLLLPFLLYSSDKKDVKTSNVNLYNIAHQPYVKYLDFLKYIDPNTKLPKAEYLTDKPLDFTFDEQGSYISKFYRFNWFYCSMFFAIDDMNYTKKDDEIEVKLHKYPKYIKLEIPHLYSKTYIDEAQDGIDGKNEREYIWNRAKEIDNFPDCIIPINYYNSADKKTGLYELIKEYLDSETGLPKKEFLTEKPLKISDKPHEIFDKKGVSIAKDYFLDADTDEKNMNDMTIGCILYFPVNDVDFIDKEKKEDIMLKLNKNPIFINFYKEIYNYKDDKIISQENLWFVDPKMNSINRDEEFEEEYFDNLKKKKEKKPEEGYTI